MAFSTDNGGVALYADIKLIEGASTWNTRLSQIGRARGNILICTEELLDDKPDFNRSCGDLRYLRRILDKRDAIDPGLASVMIITNIPSEAEAIELKILYPNLTVYLTDFIEGTTVLMKPETVWYAPGGFGDPGKECRPTPFEGIGFHSRQAFRHYAKAINGHLKKYGYTELTL